MVSGQPAKKSQPQTTAVSTPATQGQQALSHATGSAHRLNLHDVERRQKFVDLQQEDLVRILAVKNLVLQNLDRFVSVFFDYLRNFDEAAGLFRNREALEEAKKFKREHLVAMVQGDYGAPYVEQR